jgi:hypothetical protein
MSIEVPLIFSSLFSMNRTRCRLNLTSLIFGLAPSIMKADENTASTREARRSRRLSREVLNLTSKRSAEPPGSGNGAGVERGSGYIKIDLRSNHQRFCWWSVSHSWLENSSRCKHSALAHTAG